MGSASKPKRRKKNKKLGKIEELRGTPCCLVRDSAQVSKDKRWSLGAAELRKKSSPFLLAGIKKAGCDGKKRTGGGATPAVGQSWGSQNKKKNSGHRRERERSWESDLER